MKGSILCLAMVLGAGASGARAAWLYVDAFQHSEPFYETNVELSWPGATAVGAVAPDGTAIALSESMPGQFNAWLGPFPTFAGFRAATVGPWRLTGELGPGAEAAYDFTVNDYRPGFSAASFPAAPTMLAPTDGATNVPATPTFLWDNGGPHTGAMESLFVSVWSQSDPSVGALGTIPLNSESWTPPVVLPDGPGAFLVQYETNENEDANVTDPVFNAAASTTGDPGIVWEGSSGDLFSRDLIEFGVVPEPATLWLAGAGVPLLAGYWRRCRRKRGRSQWP